MDASGIGSLSTALTQSKVNDEISVRLLKKSMEIEAQSALQLVQALPRTSSGNPPHLGQNVDVKA